MQGSYTRFIVPICCFAGLVLVAVGTAQANGYAQCLGAILIAGPLFIQSWLRAFGAVKNDDARGRRFHALNRRLFRNALIASLAMVALIGIFRLFASPGDERIFFGLIPLVVLLTLVFDTGAAALSIHRLR